MEWTASLYRPAFGTHDFHLLENDYAIGNRKCGGNAQYLCKGRWLHHSSLLWDYQSHRMDLLTLPPKMPVYRQRRQHEDFLCRLSSYFKSDVHFSEALLAHLHSQVSLQPVAWELVERLLASPHRKATELCDLFAYSATT
jgi:lipoate-protein ligase A